jgi:hypothetical protein
MAIKPSAKLARKPKRARLRSAGTGKISTTVAAQKKRAAGLSPTALEFLTANSPTPDIFNDASERPPFDLLDK